MFFHFLKDTGKRALLGRVKFMAKLHDASGRLGGKGAVERRPRRMRGVAIDHLRQNLNGERRE